MLVSFSYILCGINFLNLFQTFQVFNNDIIINFKICLTMLSNSSMFYQIISLLLILCKHIKQESNAVK
jgi:hypothetical protein